MKKYGWITDIHLNFKAEADIFKFLKLLKSKNLDGIFLTGDISDGLSLIKHLNLMEEILQIPIYFVIGNHDFYYSSFAEIENKIANLNSKNLIHLDEKKIISLNDEVALIGNDGFYDARWREPYTSFIFLWDWFLIKDFRALFSNEDRMALCRDRAWKSANFISNSLREALRNHSTIYLLTHIPPWPEKTGKLFGLYDKFWMPYNSSKFMADAISDVMSMHPKQKVICISGHSHKLREEQIEHNISLRVGKASHDKAELQEIIEI